MEKLEEDFPCLSKEEDDVFAGDDLDFVVRHFNDSDDANKGEGSEDKDCEDEATSAFREIEEEEMDPDELEGKLKKLKEMFSLPKVLIKRTLCAADVKGNMEIAIQRLQEFRDMENLQDQLKVPMKPKCRVAEKTLRSGGDFQAPRAGFNSVKRALGSNWDGMEKRRADAEQQSFQEDEEGRQRTKKNNRQENELKGEQEQPKWSKKSFDKNEEQMDGNQLYRHQGPTGRGGFRGRPRRGLGPSGGYRGGFVQSQRDKQECREDGFQENWSFGCQGDDYTRRPPGVRGNWNGRGNPPKIKPKPRRRPRGVARGRSRGGFVHVYEEYREDVYQDWDNRGRVDNLQEDDEFGFPLLRYQDDGRLQFAQGRRGRDQPSHNYRGGDDLNIRYQANRERPGSGANREQGRGGMRRAQSLSSVEVDRLPERRGNEEDESRFERNKLVIRGLSASTTDEGVRNFIEAKSGEEVKEVAMLGKGKALVTMAEQITSK